MSNPSPCEKCGESHDPRLCRGHVIDCPDCGWSIGNTVVGRACVECEGGPVRIRPCRAYPIRGLRVCLSHGGAARQSRAAARRRIAQAETEGEVAALLAVMEERHGRELSGHDAIVLALNEAHLQLWLHKHFAGEESMPFAPDHLDDTRPTSPQAGVRYWTGELARIGKMASDAGIDQARLDREERLTDELVVVVERTLNRYVELAERGLLAIGVDLAAVRRVFAEARPRAARYGLGLSEAIEAQSSEVPDARDD